MSNRALLNDMAAEFGPEQAVTAGKWFGKPCLKVGGKVFAVLWSGDMVFKLTGEAHSEALQLEGAHLFDPRGKGHPMREWVQIPVAESTRWSRFARLACEYVTGAAQAEKDAIIRGLVKARRKILDAASLLSPVQQDEVFLGVWSVKDLLAHLAGWDDTNVKAVEEILAGQKPRFWKHYDRDWKSYNARLVVEYKRDDFAELLAMVQESHRRLIGFLQTVPDAEYLKRRKIKSLLRAEIRDEEEHHRQVEELRKRRAG
ncbi:MAG: ClbS/DfsB family four-helix bundle protein [Anaerolineales bacterium]|nr:MAG: ClbS/DfsB family four-helix bundle protein [Anaerolineales bacterium]